MVIVSTVVDNHDDLVTTWDIWCHNYWKVRLVLQQPRHSKENECL